MVLCLPQVPDADCSVEGGGEDDVLGERVELDDGDLVAVGREHRVGLVQGLDEAALRDVPNLKKKRSSKNEGQSKKNA